MIEGALYAFKFHKGIRLFIYQDPGDGRFIRALQQDLLISGSSVAPSNSATWRFSELSGLNTLRLATQEEAILWSNQYNSVTATLIQQDTNHYSIY